MGCINIVIYLIQHKANVDVPTVRGETPLHLAVRAKQADIIKILLRNGAKVDAKAKVCLRILIVFYLFLTFFVTFYNNRKIKLLYTLLLG